MEADEEVHRGPLRDFDKKPKAELLSPDKEPPAKKRRVDTQPEDPIEAKLSQIRSNMDQSVPQSTAEKSIAKTPPTKKNKKKNKNKNKTPQKNVAESKAPDFDYSSVDFKKFAGGSIVEQKNEIKMKYHGKVCCFRLVAFIL